MRTVVIVLMTAILLASGCDHFQSFAKSVCALKVEDESCCMMEVGFYEFNFSYNAIFSVENTCSHDLLLRDIVFEFINDPNRREYDVRHLDARIETRGEGVATSNGELKFPLKLTPLGKVSVKIKLSSRDSERLRDLNLSAGKVLARVSLLFDIDGRTYQGAIPVFSEYANIHTNGCSVCQ